MVKGSMKRKLLFSFSLLLSMNLFILHSQNDRSAAFAKAKAGKAKDSAVAAPEAVAPLRSTPAPKDNAPQVIQSFEQRLFFKNYSEDQLTVRLTRIEKQVFGQPIESSTEDRLARLDEVLRSKLDEERKVQEAEAYRAGTTSGGAPRSTTAAPRVDGDDDHIERARMSIQAARDEEISGLLAEGVELYRQKRGMQAQEKFEQVLRLDPQNAQAHFNLGIIEETMGNYVEALGSYKQAAQKEPGNKEYVEAVTAIEKKATTQSRLVGKRADLRVLAESANAAWKRGEYISALDLYQQLDAKEPNRALVKYNIGSIYLMLKDQDNAVQFYEQAAKLEPGEPKYVKAYQELSAALKKARREQAKVQQEANAEWAEAHNSAPANEGKKPKLSKKQSRSSNVGTTGGAQQFYGSQFAPYAVVGGNPPQTQQTGAPSRPIMPSQQRAPMQQPNTISQGRPTFGLAPSMVGGFLPQAAARPAPQQPAAANIMIQFGLIGKSNGEGVTVVNVKISSRAASAGVVPGDDIRAVDGIEVKRPEEIAEVLSRKNPAERIPMLILRNGNLAVLNL